MKPTEKEKSLLHSVNPIRIFIPVIIGLGVISYLFYKEFDPEAFETISLTASSYLWLFAAFLLMLSRDIGYIIRLKILSSGSMNWLQATRVIFLWEFTSAVTPSAIGGTSIAVLYVHKENISIGKSTAIVMATSFLDEMYFLLSFPLLFFLIQPEQLFATNDANNADYLSFTNEFFYFATIGYGLKFIFTLFIAYGLFVNPQGIKRLLLALFKLPFLSRWAHNGEQIGNDIVLASNELKKQKAHFWIKAFTSTTLSWTARYWVVNCLFLAFFAVGDHFLIFARQLVMWIMMLVSPTPGGSGFAEYVFNEYLGEFIAIAGLAIPLAFLWRVISYYFYLVIGAIIFPRWMKEKF